LRQLGPVFQILGNPLIIEFLLGVLIARLPAWRGAVLGIPIGAAALAATGFLGIAPSGERLAGYIGEYNLQRLFVCGLPAAMIVYGVMQMKARRGLWTYLGEMSYSLYLFHTPVVWLAVLLWMSFPIRGDLAIVLTIVASILVSWRLHELIERPILRALPSDWKRSQAVAA
jgi:exopolysaccharide production protein ExoZ